MNKNERNEIMRFAMLMACEGWTSADALGEVLDIARREHLRAERFAGGQLDETDEQMQAHDDLTAQRLDKVMPDGFGWVWGSGDPRGPALLLTVPSGRVNDWGRRGIIVPQW